MNNQNLDKNIEAASAVVGKTWPLYGFVTSNPLSGYEANSFQNAIAEVKKYRGGDNLPSAYMFSTALERGEIDKTILKELLLAAKFNDKPEVYLAQMEAQKVEFSENPNQQIDSILTKWLSAFMDEGIAEWEMPSKSDGFYAAWRKLAVYDQEIGVQSISEIPKTADEAIALVLQEFPTAQHQEILKSHLAALPGWVGYIKYRIAEHSVWQTKYPISLNDYLAVRLWIAKHKKLAILLEGKTESQKMSQLQQLKYIWLQAWEKSWQVNVLEKIADNQEQLNKSSKNNQLAAAQMVFCIDTRSELIRRHVEKSGNYETFGYAGFFGLATDYKDVNTGLTRKSCPPIVTSAYIIEEEVQKANTDKFEIYKQHKNLEKFGRFLSMRMKNMLPSAFGYVEGAGLFYGFKLLLRTFLPTALSSNQQKSSHEHLCETSLRANSQEHSHIPLTEKVAIVNSAFQLLGWNKFAPLVIFAGHGSHSANNAFGSSLDCGACAASPGRHNARMLATLANLPEVRKSLRQDFNVHIPLGTFFMGAEHNTTTDEIVLFASAAPSSHHLAIQLLKSDLKAVQKSAVAERLNLQNNVIATANKKAYNWAETRPEWGLAKNAGFIVGPREITKDLNLDGRCFLHSYDWELDPEGKALEGIMQGPMVVTQWINNHYYFATVDNQTFGGGTKVTHNVTGKFGVVQGNGGDLKTGLPLQSVNSADQEMYHQPLRLSVFIQAPLARIDEILQRNPNLKSLLQKEWIYLLVMDPLADNNIKKYENWAALEVIKDDLSIAV